MPRSELFAIMTALALTPAAVAQNFGPDKVYLEADTLIDDQENGVMIAEGNVVARYESRQLFADRVIYNLETKKVRAIGNVRILDPDGTMRTADEVEVDEQLSDGVATQFSAQLPPDAVVVARTATRAEGGINTLDYAIYTACPICAEEDKPPTWTLRARRAVQNSETQMITYNDAVFHIKGVPVLYLPYFAHPDPTSKRRSGLLVPKPEISSKLGFAYEQPYYWSISPSQDLTIIPKLYTNVNSALGLQYRKKFYSGRIDIDASAAYDYEFDSNGDRIFFDSNGRYVEDPDDFVGTLTPSESKFRGHIFAEGRFAINRDWQWGFAAENVSDDFYLRRYDISGENDLRGILDTDVYRLINQLYVVGQTENFYADVVGFHTQGLLPSDDDSTFARVTPMAFANKVFDFGKFGITSLEGSLAILDRSNGNDSQRATAIAEWTNSYIAPAGLIFEPELQVRADQFNFAYQTTSTVPGYEDSVSRTSGLAAATLRWPFIRRGESSTVMIEPIVTIGYGEASADNSEIFVQDTVNFEYDMPVLFEADPFSQYDVIEQGGRAVAGLRANAKFDNGIALRGTVGRRFRDEPDPFFSYASNLGGEKSDYLVGAGFDFGSTFSFDSSIRLDDDYEMKRIDVKTDLDWWRFSNSVSYFKVDEDIAFPSAFGSPSLPVEGVSFTTQIQLTDSLNFGYQIKRNLAEEFNRSQLIALRWSDDCSFFEIGWKQSGISVSGLGNSEAIFFGFGFNTLGEVSPADFD